MVRVPCKLSSKLTSLDFTLAPTVLAGGPQTTHICSDIYLSYLSSRVMASTSGYQQPKACKSTYPSTGTRLLLFPSVFHLGGRNEGEHVELKDDSDVEMRGVAAVEGEGLKGGVTVVVIS